MLSLVLLLQHPTYIKKSKITPSHCRPSSLSPYDRPSHRKVLEIMSMNIFRLMGDVSHQIAIITLIRHLCRAKNARGISIKTQELRLLVFCTRYTDLFTHFYGPYNSVAKIVYIAATTGILIMCKTGPISILYNKEQDSFPHWKFAVLPCAALAMLTHWISFGGGLDLSRNLQELLWLFSIYLESIAILPQLLTLRKYRLVENLTGKFVFFLGMYRFFYIINWVYRSYYERGYRHHYGKLIDLCAHRTVLKTSDLTFVLSICAIVCLVVYACGVVQTLLYADFFYQYCK